MSYQLRGDETISKGLCRIYRKQLKQAVAVARGEVDHDDTPAHRTRKHLKKARAVLWLVRKKIGRTAFKRQDRVLRDVGRLISEVRDAEVRLQTVRQLQNVARRQHHRSFRKVEELLMLELQHFVVAFAEWQQQAIPMLEKLRDDASQWHVNGFSETELGSEVRKTYQRARNALGHAQVEPTEEYFHEFRKEAKMLWYHLRILRPVNPLVLANMSSELNGLTDLLGRAHDLSFLGQRVRSEKHPGNSRDEWTDLLTMIEASEIELQFGATQLAERFFGERPKQFRARLDTWLEDWAGGEMPSLADELVQEKTPAPPVVPV